jgi:hypothetical protein
MTELNELKGHRRRLQRRGRQALRKEDLKELANHGQNWALEELQQLRQAEREKNRLAYQQFKSRRSPEVLRLKWREAKARQRSEAARATAEAEERKRKADELAVKVATITAEAKREERAEEARAEIEIGVELEILRIPLNPRMVLC